MYMCVHQYMSYKAAFVYICVFISTCHIKQPLYVYVFHQYMPYKAAFVCICVYNDCNMLFVETINTH